MSERRISILTLLERQRAWLAGIPLVIVLIAGAAALLQSQRLLAFQAQGVKTEARILNMRESVSRSATSDGTRTQRSYHADYQFDTADGATQEGSTRVSAGYYRRNDPGETVPIHYMPDNPDQVMLDWSHHRGGLYIYTIPALIALALTAYIGRRYWRRTASMLRAARGGEARQATVLDYLPSRTRIGDEPASWRLHWRDETGAEGESLNQGRMLLMAYARVGDTITVMVDPVGEQTFWERDLYV